MLLLLVNRILASSAADAVRFVAAARHLLDKLDTGPQTVNSCQLDSRHCDLGDSRQRTRAVRATMQASIELLGPHGPERFAERGIFADENVPLELVEALWRETAGLEKMSRARC